MQTHTLKTLFLAWQATNRQWFPVGKLVADPAKETYEFNYTKGAIKAKDTSGFNALLAFPDFNQHYFASELFPLFKNRILSASRKDFSEYIESLDMDPHAPDLLEVLSVTGGTRQTDSLEVFPEMKKENDGSFKCRFFIHGIRHVNEAGVNRAGELKEGENLQMMLEVNNPKTQRAIILSSNDYLPLGWTPRYLVSDLAEAMVNDSELTAEVIKVNPPPVPLNRRYLIEMKGKLPHAIKPMSGEEFKAIN